MQSRGRHISAMIVVVCSMAASPARADVDLTWDGTTRAALVGRVLEVDLYAVSDNDQDQSIAAIDVVLSWDPQRLPLLGVINGGPYEWLISGFELNDPGDLNISLEDGNALYTALSALGDPAVATPDGLLVTTFQFFPIAEVDASEITIEENLSSTLTRVFDGDAPNVTVTGELYGVSVTIIRRPKMARPQSPLPGTIAPDEAEHDVRHRPRRIRWYRGTSDP